VQLLNIHRCYVENLSYVQQ